MLVNEEFVPLLGFEGLYEISPAGVLRRCACRGTKGGVVKTKVDGSGPYAKALVVLTARRKRGGRRARVQVVVDLGRLVLLQFYGQPPSSRAVAKRKNGAVLDCRFENLRWGYELDPATGLLDRRKRRGTWLDKLAAER